MQTLSYACVPELQVSGSTNCVRGKTYRQEFNMVYRDTNVYDYGCLLTANIIIIDHFYIVLFSALEQTHCARM